MAEFNRNMDIANSVHQEKLPLAASVHFLRRVNQLLLNQHHNHLLCLLLIICLNSAPNPYQEVFLCIRNQLLLSTMNTERAIRCKVTLGNGFQRVCSELKPSFSHCLEITGKLCNTQHLGRYSKAGNPMVCFLYLE